MTVLDIIEYMNQGREIEFELEGNQYFIEPDYETVQCIEDFDEGKYQCVLYACSDKSVEIFRGTPQEIIRFEFYNHRTLNDHFEMFTIKFIL